MAGLLNQSSVMMCPHGGQVQAVTTNSRTRVAGGFALRQSDTFVIAGCPFFLGPLAHPCVQVQWVQPSAQSQIIDDFTLTEESVGLCVAADQAVQGTVLIVETQPRVSGL
ncbi:MAG: hypothetical protein M3178_00955 [Pseudomonadota bacterium]|nr:hypothetical protein [Pseudomonadota bacterium]